jgi:hypothetical protein
VAEKLRELALPDRPTGAAHLRWPVNHEFPTASISRPVGLLVLASQRLREGDTGWVEVGSRIHGWVVTPDGSSAKLEEAQLGAMIRGLLGATVRLTAEEAPALLTALQSAERTHSEDLRRPSEEDRAARVVNVATPVFAGVIA